MINQSYDLADTLIHEFNHNFLYALEEDAPFFETGTEHVEAFYSPWRPDPRDLHGVIHAVYVFLATTRYWLSVRRAGEDSGPLADYVTDRLVRYPLQLRIGAGVLAEHAQFTDYGRTLFAEMLGEIDELTRELAAAGVPEDARAVICEQNGDFVPQTGPDGAAMTVRNVIGEHARRFDSTGTGRAALAAVGIAG
jgi:hypothetical protein